MMRSFTLITVLLRAVKLGENIMVINLHGQSLLSLFDLSNLEIAYLLDLAKNLKNKKQAGEKSNLLSGKSIVLIFNKPSTRTRCAFEAAVFSEGGHVTFLTDSHMGYKESLEDTARVLGAYYDGICFRGFDHYEAEALAKYSGIPVWNALTDQHHPTQALADLMTIRECIDKPLYEVKCVYVGDGRNNVATSLMIAAAKMGMTFVNLAPKSLWPSTDFLQKVNVVAAETQANIQCDQEIDRAVKGADVIYTDVWVSMGEESKWEERIHLLHPYQVNDTMLKKTNNQKVIFMHCLPALHDRETTAFKELENQFGIKDMEVTDEVFRGYHSVVFEQSENRLHTIKAVILATLWNI